MAGRQLGVTAHDYLNVGSLDPGQAVSGGVIVGAAGVPQGAVTVTVAVTGTVNVGDAVVIDTANDWSVKSATSGTPAGVIVGRTPTPQIGVAPNVSPALIELGIMAIAGIVPVIADGSFNRGDPLTISSGTAGRVVKDNSASITTTMGFALQAGTQGNKALMLLG